MSGSLKRIGLSLCLAVLFVACSINSIFADKIHDEYQDLFFPGGLATITNVDGKTMPDTYQFYGDVEIPGTNTNAVLYSIEYVESGSSDADNIYSVYLALIQKSKNGLLVLDSVNVNKYINEPEFSEMDGLLNYLKIANCDAVHLNMKNVLSGNGQISHKSDIIFLIRNNKFLPVLELSNNSDSGGYHGYENDGNYHEHFGLQETFIYVAKRHDGVHRVFTQKYKFEMDTISKDISDEFLRDIIKGEYLDGFEVYEFDKATHKFMSKSKAVSLPENAVKLRRIDEPDLDEWPYNGQER